MTNNTKIDFSKFISYILRHKPEEIGITLDIEGWVNIDTLILQMNKFGKYINKNVLLQIVNEDKKKRFTISEDGLKIRAEQGHSTIQVNINYSQKIPPCILYHGTAIRFIDSIEQKGLIPGERQFVHLSINQDTAIDVGKRYGKPIVLTINSKLMQQQGYTFYLTENGIWLTKHVPVKFIKFN